MTLVANKQDHGPGQHDYPAWQREWLELCNKLDGVKADTAWEWPSEKQWEEGDVIIFYFWNHNWSAARYAQLDQFQSRGGGLVLFHAATIADKEAELLAARIGLAAQPGPTKYLHTPFTLAFKTHPITAGVKSMNLLDEPYWPMIGAPSRVTVLATTKVEGTEHPMLWTFQKGKGRVFASIPGHYTWTFQDPLFRWLVWRGIAWAADQPLDAFANAFLRGEGIRP